MPNTTTTDGDQNDVHNLKMATANRMLFRKSECSKMPTEASLHHLSSLWTYSAQLTSSILSKLGRLE